MMMKNTRVERKPKMKKLVSLLLVLILMLAIPCTAMAYQPSRADVTRAKINSVRATCIAYAKTPDVVMKCDEGKTVIVQDKNGRYKEGRVYVSQDAGFVSYALKRAGIIKTSMTYDQLKAFTARIPNPRNGALVFNGSIVGFYFDGNVYYSTFTKFVCIKYRAKTWSVGWIKGL